MDDETDISGISEVDFDTRLKVLLGVPPVKKETEDDTPPDSVFSIRLTCQWHESHKQWMALMSTLIFCLGRREVLLTGFRTKKLLHKIPVRIKNPGFLQQAQTILRGAGLFRLTNPFYQFFY